MDRAQNILKFFFWVSFGAFLCASIPHVAYFFRAFEPIAPAGSSEDIWWWAVSYFIAASIDVTIFLLSMTVASLQRRGKSRSLIISVWVFILALAGLSWFINDKYALHFLNAGMIGPTAIALPFIGTIPDINPLIASCFQALAIAYTWISDKIAADEAPKTAAQLEVEAKELEAKKKALAKIKELNKGRVQDASIGAIDGAFNIFSHAKKRIDEARGKDDQPAIIGANETASIERDTGELEAFNTATIDVESDDQSSLQSEMSDCLETPENDIQSDKWSGFTSHSTVPLESAAELINVSVNTIKTLRNKGILKTAPKNANLITTASLKTYDVKRSMRSQVKRSGVNKPRLKVVGE